MKVLSLLVNSATIVIDLYNQIFSLKLTFFSNCSYLSEFNTVLCSLVSMLLEHFIRSFTEPAPLLERLLLPSAYPLRPPMFVHHKANICMVISNFHCVSTKVRNDKFDCNQYTCGNLLCKKG